MKRRGWGAARSTSYNGVTYASKAEARYAMKLAALKKAGKIAWWSSHPRVGLMVNEVLVCVIIHDFRVHLPNGTFEFHEVKGHQTAVWKLKRKLFEALNPGTKYVVIPARDV